MNFMNNLYIKYLTYTANKDADRLARALNALAERQEAEDYAQAEDEAESLMEQDVVAPFEEDVTAASNEEGRVLPFEEDVDTAEDEDDIVRWFEWNDEEFVVMLGETKVTIPCTKHEALEDLVRRARSIR